MNTPLYLDDISVGDRFTSGEHAMDEAQIKAFAEQFDPQPFHLDDAAAQATLFGVISVSMQKRNPEAKNSLATTT